MIRSKLIGRWAALLGALLAYAGGVQARDIGGTISSTLTIIEDSQLVDDVICTVTGAPCIAIGAPNVKLELNGFTTLRANIAETLSPVLITEQGELGPFASTWRSTSTRQL